MVRVATRYPAPEGVKVTLMVQPAPTASEAPQFWLSPKSLLFGPESEMPVMLNAWLPGLERVTVCAVPAVPGGKLGKDSPDGLTAEIAASPMPVRVSFCGL